MRANGNLELTFFEPLLIKEDESVFRRTASDLSLVEDALALKGLIFSDCHFLRVCWSWSNSFNTFGTLGQGGNLEIIDLRLVSFRRCDVIERSDYGQ